MSTGRFSSFATLVPVSVLVLVLLCIVTTCKAKKNQDCHVTSSCGHIQNISYPFRLKTDPQNCGDPSYELACENNQTILYLNSMDYYVQSINYEINTIRLLDPAIRNNQCPSFPLHSLDFYDIARVYASADNSPVIFITCPREVESSRYVDTASCNKKNTSSSSSMKEYVYVVSINEIVPSGIEPPGPLEVEDSCMINTVAWYSTGFPMIDNTSFLSILDMMSNGFSLTWWYQVYCRECEAKGWYCHLEGNNNVTCQRVGVELTMQIYKRIWGIWEVLPDMWWGKFSIDQFYKQRYPRVDADPRTQDFLLLISAIASKLIAMGLLSRFLCGFLCLLILVVCKYRRRHLSNDENIEEFLQAQINLMPIRYSYADIRKMTKKFKHKLGEGGYGSVFKGKLRSGLFVAVKMMNKSKASGQEFINEVATIGTIHHVNVVQLIGFCVEGSKHALVYEFMPNGSLEKYIFLQEEKTISLSYEKMFEISLGVARGIDYLHRGCEMQILHFDIKPHNILLDENFNPKVSDFGLAKLYSTDDSIVSLTAARGTMGYMAPELFYKNIGGVSYKADVYSYGMLLMEMAGRRKNLNPFLENLSQIYFPSWVYDQFSEGKEIVTEDTSGEERTMVKKMILVGLWCIQMKPVDRPSMNKIVEMLERDDEHLQMPPKPSLYPEQSPPAEDHANYDN